MKEIGEMALRLSALSALTALIGHMRLGLGEGVRLISALVAVGVVVDMLSQFCAWW